MGHGLGGRALVVLLGPVTAVGVGGWVYHDARWRGQGDRAPWGAPAIGGGFPTGSLPGLAALAVTAEPVAQGVPTALRLPPGLVVLAAYGAFR